MGCTRIVPSHFATPWNATIQHLKINGVYMLLRNMNVSDGFCNDTRFTLIDIDGHILTCRMIHDDKSKKDKTFYCLA